MFRCSGGQVMTGQRMDLSPTRGHLLSRFDISVVFVSAAVALAGLLAMNVGRAPNVTRCYILTVALVAGLLSEVPEAHRQSRRGASREGLAPAFLICGFVVVLTAWRLHGASWTGGEASVVYVGGIALVVLGPLLRICARRSLGEWFTYAASVGDRRAIVTTGMYSRVRHPAYLGTLLFMYGTALATGSLLGLAMASVAVPLILQKARREERLLLARFPIEYSDYRRSVGMLLPRLWHAKSKTT
jgi:protein-S-isoprenylcysteine O-methyltransferase Ste14